MTAKKKVRDRGHCNNSNDDHNDVDSDDSDNNSDKLRRTNVAN